MRSRRAYLVLLRVEIARFTRCAGLLRTEMHRLVSVALILTSRWTAVSCYAALCSPDLPPASPEGAAGGGLARFTARIIDDAALVSPGSHGRPGGSR